MDTRLTDDGVYYFCTVGFLAFKLATPRLAYARSTSLVGSSGGSPVSEGQDGFKASKNYCSNKRVVIGWARGFYHSSFCPDGDCGGTGSWVQYFYVFQSDRKSIVMIFGYIDAPAYYLDN